MKWQFKTVQSMESATMETSNFKKMQSCGGCSNCKKRPWTCMVYGIDRIMTTVTLLGTQHTIDTNNLKEKSFDPYNTNGFL